MTLEEFGALIGTIGIEAVYGYYKEAQAAPYITYAATEKNCIYADGRCIYSEDWIVLRLVSQARDTASEALIEQTLTEYCDDCWRLNYHHHETETNLFHWEWVFQIEE